MTQPKIQKRSAATATLPPHETRIKKKYKCIKKISSTHQKKIKMHQKKISRCHCVRPPESRAANLDQKKNIRIKKKI